MENQSYQLLDEQRAAAFLGVGRQTLTNWRHLRKGPAWIKVGERKVAYKRNDLENFLDRNRIDPEAA